MFPPLRLRRWYAYRGTTFAENEHGVYVQRIDWWRKPFGSSVSGVESETYIEARMELDKWQAEACARGR